MHRMIRTIYIVALMYSFQTFTATVPRHALTSFLDQVSFRGRMERLQKTVCPGVGVFYSGNEISRLPSEAGDRCVLVT